MPIATVQLPNGKIADIEVPQGATPQEIESFVMSQPEFVQQPAAPQAPEAPQPAQEPQSFQERSPAGVANFAKGIPQGLGNAFIGGVQAATDVGEKAAQLIEKLYFGDNLQMNTFGNRLADQVKARKAEQAQLPTSERAGIFVGEVAPTIAAGAGTGARVAAITGSRIAGIATGGGIGGATSSAVSMQEQAGLGNRAVETAKGAAIGTAFGTGLGVAGKVVGAIGKGAKSLVTAKSAEDILAARLPKEQTTALLEQLKTATPDNPVLLPDIAGDSIKGLTRSVAKISTGRDIVTDALEKRSQGAVSRVANHLSRDVSPVENYFGRIDDLNKSRQEMASPFYKKSFERNVKLSPRTNKVLFDKLTPEIKSVRNDFRITKKEAPDNSLILLDKVKKSLYDKAQVLKRQGAKEQAAVFDDLRKELTQKLKIASPDYAKALSIFEDESKIITAQQKGLDFSSLRPEEIRREVLDMLPAERDGYRIGVRENLQKTVSSTADGADPAKRIFGNEFKREQLRAVFGNEKKFAEFEQKMANEIRAADTKAKVLGGSRTDYNMAGDDEFLNKMINGGIRLAKSKVNPLYLVEAAYNAVTNKFAGINEKNAGELAKILVNRPDAVNALESIVAKQNNPLQKRVLDEVKQYILTNLATQSSMRGNNDAQAADTENMTEEEIRAQLIDANNQNKKQGLPLAYSQEEIKNNPSLIKKRYYKYGI